MRTCGCCVFGRMSAWLYVCLQQQLVSLDGGEWLLLGWRWRKLCLLYMHVSSRSLPQAHALLLRAGLFCSRLHTPAEGADCLTCPSLFGTLIVLVPSAQRCTIPAAL